MLYAEEGKWVALVISRKFDSQAAMQSEVDCECG